MPSKVQYERARARTQLTAILDALSAYEAETRGPAETGAVVDWRAAETRLLAAIGIRSDGTAAFWPTVAGILEARARAYLDATEPKPRGKAVPPLVREIKRASAPRRGMAGAHDARADERAEDARRAHEPSPGSSSDDS